MGWKRKLGGGILTVLGFMLSPLSWWNDVFVNLPLALAFAWTVSLFAPSAFEVSLVVGYWLTNLAGFMLMHHGLRQLKPGERKPYTRRQLFKDLSISLGYTALLVILIQLGVLKPIEAYFSR